MIDELGSSDRPERLRMIAGLMRKTHWSPKTIAVVSEAADELERLRAKGESTAFVWSSELPKVVGWWWTRIEGDEDSEELTWMSEADIAVHVYRWSKSMLYAGPIPAPKEPTP